MKATTLAFPSVSHSLHKLQSGILVIAVAVDRDEIEQHWSWIEKNLMPTIGRCHSRDAFDCLPSGTFDLEEDVRHFVLTKIAGLVANDEHFAQPGRTLRSFGICDDTI